MVLDVSLSYEIGGPGSSCFAPGLAFLLPLSSFVGVDSVLAAVFSTVAALSELAALVMATASVESLLPSGAGRLTTCSNLELTSSRTVPGPMFSASLPLLMQISLKPYARQLDYDKRTLLLPDAGQIQSGRKQTETQLPETQRASVAKLLLTV